jgi:two-component system response regulator PilR (NtrC family)
MTTASVLIVDDEADIRELIEIALSRMGLRTDSAATLAEARGKLAQQRYDVCITDMRLPDGSGVSLIAHIQEHSPQTPVAVITAYGSAEAAVESLKAGAFDFVSKPVDVGMLRKLVDTALKLRGAEPVADTAPQLLGEHQSVRQLRALIDRLSRSQAPVHISGESGTGKELVARLIHLRGPRASGPFVPVNCGAIPSELMESEFFGHLKGSFTGAHRDKAGLFQAAEGGTLFLDEVAELPLHMQVKLLRALQERTVRPVGSETESPVNVRVISATHSDLGALVEQGRFRQDLYYRLNVIEVRTPALRERPADIPVLAQHILEQLADTLGLALPPSLEPDAIEALQGYAFPGNVRELENILERAMTLCDDGRIHRSDLQLRTTPTAVPGHGLGQQIEDIERQAIRDALIKTRYNKTRAAELLGMSFRSLRYRIKKLGLDQE